MTAMQAALDSIAASNGDIRLMTRLLIAIEGKM